MVFSGLFPTDGDDFERLREALEKLRLNDGSLMWEAETSPGIRLPCWLPGPAPHGDRARAAGAEYDLDLVATAPSPGDPARRQRQGDQVAPGPARSREQGQCLRAVCPGDDPHAQ